MGSTLQTATLRGGYSEKRIELHMFRGGMEKVMENNTCTI